MKAFRNMALACAILSVFMLCSCGGGGGGGDDTTTQSSPPDSGGGGTGTPQSSGSGQSSSGSGGSSGGGTSQSSGSGQSSSGSGGSSSGGTSQSSGSGQSSSGSGGSSGSATTQSSPPAQTPGLYQNVDQNGVGYVPGSSPAYSSISAETIFLCKPGGTGNFAVVWITYPTGYGTPSGITDNASTSNTYTKLLTVTDNTNGSAIDVWTAPITYGGATKVTLSLPSGCPAVGLKYSEWYNVSGVDVSTSAVAGSGSSVSAGSMTTTANGDLLLQVASNYSIAPLYNNNATYTAGSGWSLLTGSTQSIDGSSAQWMIQSSAGSITPSFSCAVSGSFPTAAVALKASTSPSGTPPSGVSVMSAQHVYFNNSRVASTTSTSSVTIGTGYKTFTVPSGLSWIKAGAPIFASNGMVPNVNGYTYGTVSSYSGTSLVIDVTSTYGSGSYSSWTIQGTEVTIQRASVGNLQILLSSVGPGSEMPGLVSGSSSGTWTQRKAETLIAAGLTGVVSSVVYDAVNQPALSETLTIGFPTCQVGVDTDVIILDVQGASESPYDTSMSATAAQTSTTSATCPDGSSSTLTLAPSQSGGLMVSVMGIQYVYITGGSGVVQSLTVQSTPPNGGSSDTYGNVPTDQADGYGIYYPTNTASETFTWTVPTGTAVGYWAGAVVSYR